MKFLFLSDKSIQNIQHALGIASAKYTKLQGDYNELEGGYAPKGHAELNKDVKHFLKACEFSDLNAEIDTLLDNATGSSSNQGIAALKSIMLQMEKDAAQLAEEYSNTANGEDAWQGNHEQYGRYMAATAYAASIKKAIQKL